MQGHYELAVLKDQTHFDFLKRKWDMKTKYIHAFFYLKLFKTSCKL